MSWSEQEHPSDDDRKFTFKNRGGGANKETSTEILYKNSKIKKEEEIMKQKEKSKLLDILGNKATPADVLYADNNELKEKIREDKLTNKKSLSLNNNKVELAVSAKLADIKPQNAKDIAKNESNTDFSPEAIKKAREFIQGKEGLKLDAYKDTGGVWTIGYGHIKNVKQGDKITKEEAEKFYMDDFKEHIKPLNNVKVPLSENEKIALASFIYNVGPNAFKNSTLLKKLNNGDKKGAAQEFDKWIYDNGKIQNGLVNRRKNEKNLFLKTN